MGSVTARSPALKVDGNKTIFREVLNMSNEKFLDRLNNMIRDYELSTVREVLIVARTIAECNNMTAVPLEVLNIVLHDFE